MMRQICKEILTLAICAVTFAAAPARAEPVVTTIVTDPLSGIALEGYDPVSYFTEPRPVPGVPDYEYYWGGVPWYFASAANRDAFIRAPEIYAPQHGGYCEMSLARGFLSDGKPDIFVIEEMKVYLFYSAANREAFMLSRDDALSKAAANWPGLATELIGPAPAPAAPLIETAAASP
jgi:YHS domain-containing protein